MYCEIIVYWVLLATFSLMLPLFRQCFFLSLLFFLTKVILNYLVFYQPSSTPRKNSTQCCCYGDMTSRHRTRSNQRWGNVKNVTVEIEQCWTTSNHGSLFQRWHEQRLTTLKQCCCFQRRMNVTICKSMIRAKKYFWASKNKRLLIWLTTKGTVERTL